MHAEQESPIFGLNWLQDMISFEATGSYDPEQELWTTTGPVKADGTIVPRSTGTTTYQMTLHVFFSTSGSVLGTQDNDDHTDPDQSPIFD